MKSMKATPYFVMLVLSLSTALTCSAAQRQDIARCISDPDVKRCYYIIRYMGAKEYERPDAKSRVLRDQGWGGMAQIIWPHAKDAPSGWLPTSRDVKWVKDHYEPIPFGWIEVKNLVHMDDFKRVTSCWPVASIEDSVGDWGLDAKMTLDGNALLDSSAPVKKQSHVSFAPNLVQVGDAVYGYDPKTHRLHNPHTGKEPEKINYFPPEQLKGCNGLRLEK